MKLMASLLGFKKKIEFGFDHTGSKSLAEYKQEMLVRMGRQQFEKLNDLGLTIPVALS